MPDALLSGSFPNDSTQSDQARWEENMHVCKQAPSLKFKEYEEQQQKCSPETIFEKNIAGNGGWCQMVASLSASASALLKATM